MYRVSKQLLRIKHFVKKFPWKRIFAIGLPFIFGVSIGWCFTYFSMRNDKYVPPRYRKNETPISKLSPEDIQKRPTEGLDKTYNRLKEKVKRGIENKELTAQQADLIYKKQKEVYKYRKSLKLGSKDDQKKLAAKRAEWRKWVQENKLPTIYFTGLM